MIFISVFYYFICYYVLKFKFEFKCYYSIMASRNRRHQIPPTSDSTHGTGNNQVRNSIARYDMSLPQNWTVAQLRVELNRHNIVYNKTDKKTKLIQLCFWGPHLIKIKFVWPLNPPKVTVHLFQVHIGNML